ncbi:hypothetical protein GCM10027277_08950 [Pseudoduganella ginsengisoli]|uniref:IPT/TIG domain-containing protein n=1 Tax=Pseudoduganella ginsengisoli TaxID=1462440 RepID=A0A6L6Q018_9BURK|nr:IPT/TIG domain-containing protein [Pseudoduganella ginsengisoli]MTW03167.1 hypothetical protein [Pseudoduganella ginsengisoli]
MAISRNLLSWKVAASVALAAILTACGGGGGGGASTPSAPDPAPGFSVSIDRTELKFNGDEGSTIASQVVTGSGSGGTPPATIYTGGQDLGTALSEVLVQVVGEQVRFTVYPKPQLAAGEYKGSIRLFACTDERCTQHIKGSPAEVPYTVTIAKGLKVTPGTVQLSAMAGSRASANIAVQLPSGVSTFAATSNTSWLQISNVTSNGFSITADAKAPGIYQGLATVASGNRNAGVVVSYEVKADGSTITSITPDRKSVDFTATAGMNSDSQSLTVAVPAWGKALATSIQYRGNASGWLSVAPAANGKLTLSASAATLAAGNYQADLLLSAGQDVSPISVPVSINVLGANWAIAGPSTITADGSTAAAQLGGKLSIDIPNLPVQDWTVSSSASWLKLSRTTGATRTNQVDLTIDAAALAQLENFASHTAELTISLVSGKVFPTKFAVTLNKRVPQLHFISPYTRLPGETGTYIVRGRGFDSIADAAQALRFSGVTATRITRVNDTQLELAMPAQQQGNTTISLTNSLGSDSGSVTLKVVAQPAQVYAAATTQGAKGGIVFDAERQAVYTANKTLGAVMRFKKSGANWDASSASVPRAEGVALSPDGKTLLVTAASGQVVLFDPDTLTQQGSYKAGYIDGYELNSLPNLVMRNDGKALFNGYSGVEGGSGSMPYFDLVTRKFGNIGGSYAFGWAIASGDGSHINIVQSASYTPAPPMVTLDSNDTVAKPSSVGLSFWYEAAQSLRGERFVEGTYTVWDRDFNIIGKISLPEDGYYGRTPVLSPDGSRAYIMAYPSRYSGTATKPRVYVLDSSTRMITTTNLPLLGYFDLADYPTCNDDRYECNTRALGTISPDGKTLFFVGDTKLVVAPIPPVLNGSRVMMRRIVLPAKP